MPINSLKDIMVEKIKLVIEEYEEQTGARVCIIYIKRISDTIISSIEFEMK